MMATDPPSVWLAAADRMSLLKAAGRADQTAAEWIVAQALAWPAGQSTAATNRRQADGHGKPPTEEIIVALTVPQLRAIQAKKKTAEPIGVWLRDMVLCALYPLKPPEEKARGRRARTTRPRDGRCQGVQHAESRRASCGRPLQGERQVRCPECAREKARLYQRDLATQRRGGQPPRRRQHVTAAPGTSEVGRPAGGRYDLAAEIAHAVAPFVAGGFDVELVGKTTLVLLRMGEPITPPQMIAKLEQVRRKLREAVMTLALFKLALDGEAELVVTEAGELVFSSRDGDDEVRLAVSA